MVYSLKKLKLFSKEIRKELLKISNKKNASHVGSNLSIIEILVMLYFNVMKHNPKKPYFENRDRFILSKGHACLVYYAALCELGFFEKKEFKKFEKTDSFLLGRPNKKLSVFSNFLNSFFSKKPSSHNAA